MSRQSVAPPDPWIGQRLDERYLLEGLLGEGLTGRVYRARQERTGREVAVKLLHDVLVGDEASVRRFEREARAACRVNHRNAITVYDFGCTPAGRCYLVTELIEGETLRAVLDRGLLPAERSLRYFEEILDAVAAAHERGVIHRELHPGNIFLCQDPDHEEEPTIKVFDFGGARLQDRDEDDVTGTAHLDLPSLLSRVRYLPPERLQRQQPADPRGDVYALGLLLFELCTGRHPFEADDPLAVMAMHLQQMPPLLSEALPQRWFSPALQGLVTLLLAKDPSLRPAHAGEVRARLRQARERGLLLADRHGPQEGDMEVEVELEMEALPPDDPSEGVGVPPSARTVALALA